jgi:membrane complex biogenesis BtpA family protein
VTFRDLFGARKPLIGVLHLLPLPGAPLYDGVVQKVYDQALAELDVFKRHAIDSVIVENFRDMPYFPGRVPAETVAAMAAVSRDVVRAAGMPVGINVLRSDGEAAIAIAEASGAHYIRVNVHMGAVVADQGIVQGSSQHSVRLRSALRSRALIFADVGVKHAAPLAGRSLDIETRDLAERGLADAVIVTGDRTGVETSLADIEAVRAATSLPLLVGSGATPENIERVLPRVSGLIVGSYFKKDGAGHNFVDQARVERFARRFAELTAGGPDGPPPRRHE